MDDTDRTVAEAIVEKVTSAAIQLAGIRDMETDTRRLAIPGEIENIFAFGAYWEDVRDLRVALGL